jgi:homocitrate synthase NifV
MYAGADCVSLTIGGLGERAGNAALEEVVAALKYSYDTDTRYDLKLCSELVEYVAAAACRPIPIAKPIVGAMAFSHESGIHCRSLTQNPVSYQAFRPADIGKTTQFVLGKHSGRHTLIQYLEQHGLHHLSPKAEQILKEVKLQASLKKSALEDWEILKLIQVFSRGL